MALLALQQNNMTITASLFVDQVGRSESLLCLSHRLSLWVDDQASKREPLTSQIINFIDQVVTQAFCSDVRENQTKENMKSKKAVLKT